VIFYAAIGLATLVACEVALRLPIGRILATLLTTTRRVGQVISAKAISDHWKEKVLPAYSGRMMKASIALFLCVLAVAAPVVLAAIVATGSITDGSLALMRPLAMGLMIVLGVAYVFVRKKLAA
jgi:hypothetical protein